MSGPADTIREALNLLPLYISRVPAQAALAEVEQQLAEQKESIRSIVSDSGQVISRATARAVAAETALAEANHQRDMALKAVEANRADRWNSIETKRAEAAERRANELQALADDRLALMRANEKGWRAARDELADALRDHQWNGYTFTGMRPCIACGNEEREGHQPGCAVGAALDRHTHVPQ